MANWNISLWNPVQDAFYTGADLSFDGVVNTVALERIAPRGANPFQVW